MQVFLRIMKLAVIIFAANVLIPMLFGVTPSAAKVQSPTSVGWVILCVAGVALLQALALYPVLEASCWRGWRLALALGLFHFMVMTVLLQAEALLFLPIYFTPSTLGGELVQGALTALLISGGAGWIWRSDAGQEMSAFSAAIRFGDLGRLTLLGAAYVFLYFLFGFLVAWSQPEVQKFYLTLDGGRVMERVNALGLLFPLIQWGRGFLWALSAVWLIRSQTGKPRQAAVRTACLFAVLLSSLLLIPNPFIPWPVARVHLVETFGSDFLFGWVTAWMFWRKEKSRVSNLVPAAL
jgi:hypothetical protein